MSRTSSTSSEEEGEIIEEGDSDDDFVHLQEGSERERIFQDQVFTQFTVYFAGRPMKPSPCLFIKQK